MPKVKDLDTQGSLSTGMAKCVRHSLSSCFYLFLGPEKKARQSTGHGAGKRAATFPTVASRGTVRKYDSRTQIALHGSRDFFVWEPDLSIKVIELLLN